MKIEVIRRKAKKDGLIEEAGVYFRDHDSTLIRKMIGKGLDVYLGIENKDGIYTVIGKKEVYFSSDGSESKISVCDFVEILKQKTRESGKESEYNFIEVEKGKYLWIMNRDVLFAFWGITLLLCRAEQGVIY